MSHSRKILSQAGTSLADVYDVEGSVVGLENLDVSDIKGVHDLGPQIHSERLIVFGLIANTGNVLQSANFNVELGAFPDSINRVLSVFVISDTATAMRFCTVSITDPDTDADHPIWCWSSVDDVESFVRIDVGAGVATQFAMRPLSQVAGGLPTMIGRTGATEAMPTLNFRGETLAFGGGNMVARAFIQIMRPDPGAPAPGHPSSHGLPIPSW